MISNQSLTSWIPADLSENIVTESLCYFVSKITVVDVCFVSKEAFISVIK